MATWSTKDIKVLNSETEIYQGITDHVLFTYMHYSQLEQTSFIHAIYIQDMETLPSYLVGKHIKNSHITCQV